MIMEILVLQSPKMKLAIVTHTCNLHTWEVVARSTISDIQCSRPAWLLTESKACIGGWEDDSVKFLCEACVGYVRPCCKTTKKPRMNCWHRPVVPAVEAKRKGYKFKARMNTIVPSCVKNKSVEPARWFSGWSNWYQAWWVSLISSSHLVKKTNSQKLSSDLNYYVHISYTHIHNMER